MVPALTELKSGGQRQPLAHLLLRERGSHVVTRAIKEKLKVKGMCEQKNLISSPL